MYREKYRCIAKTPFRTRKVYLYIEDWFFRHVFPLTCHCNGFYLFEHGIYIVGLLVDCIRFMMISLTLFE